MAHDEVYGICENMCKVPVLPASETQRKISYGSELPETGDEGEIFLMI